MTENRLYHDIKAAEVVLGREVERWKPEIVNPDGKVSAIERGVILPDGTITYERIEFDS